MKITADTAKQAEVWSCIAAKQDFDTVYPWPGGVPMEVEWFKSSDMMQEFKQGIVNSTETNLDWRALMALGQMPNGLEEVSRARCSGRAARNARSDLYQQGTRLIPP